MTKLNLMQRPTLWHPKKSPETIVDLPIRLPNPVWHAVAHILFRQLWFWFALLAGVISYVLLQQDGYLLQSATVMIAMWSSIFWIIIKQMPEIRKNYENILVGIEIHENFIRIPYILTNDMPWRNIVRYRDLDFQNRNCPFFKFILMDSSYVRTDTIPVFTVDYSDNSLYVRLPLSYKRRYTAALLTSAARQLGNAEEYADGLFVTERKPVE